jgi:hypothetical protein
MRKQDEFNWMGGTGTEIYRGRTHPLVHILPFVNKRDSLL